MYCGLLMLLGEASKYQNDQKVELVRKSLCLTPLERIGMVYKENSDWGFFRVVGLYNVFLDKISNETLREKLNVEYDDRYSCKEFAELKANSDALAAELARFIWARKGAWSDRFFEYLLF